MMSGLKVKQQQVVIPHSLYLNAKRNSVIEDNTERPSELAKPNRDSLPTKIPKLLAKPGTFSVRRSHPKHEIFIMIRERENPRL